MKTMRYTILAFSLALIGCGDLGHGGRQPDSVLNGPNPPAPIDDTRNACGDDEIDFSQRSLPWHVSPLPGPEALYASPPRAPQLENVGVWQAAPLLVSGASAYRCGEFVYQDWLFDDHGGAGLPDPTDPGGPDNYLFSPSAGTLTYPSDAVYAGNAADFLELRLKPLGDATAIRVSLNTLLDPEVVAFTIALGDSASPINWPYAAGVSSPAEYFVTVHGGNVSMVRAADDSLVTPAPTVSVDLLRRQFEVRIPHAAWNPGQSTVRVSAGVGLWDGSGYLQPTLVASATSPGGISASSAALFNLAFRSQEPVPMISIASGRTIADAAGAARLQAHWWREREQADALANGDISALFANIDFAKLASGIRDDSAIPSTGFINRIFASRYEFGQGADQLSECGGISAARPCNGVMVGQLQPYALYIPAKAPPASGYGLTLLLHALSANLNQYLGSRHAQQLGERSTGTLVVTPGGRGPDGFYFEVAEADSFEVWADVARHYPLDPDWTVISGYSMGGIGSFRLAPRYPDLFARAMPIVAASSHAELLPSLRNVPVMMWSSSFDELQPIVLTEPTITDLLDLGYRLDSYRFDSWDHLSPASFDYYQPGADFLGDARIERNPAHITYVLKPSEDEPRVDVIADSAYWLSDMRLRDDSLSTGQIDAVTEGLGRGEAQLLPVVQSNGILEGGNLEPAPYTQRLQQWSDPATLPAADRLHITASNIATVTVHPERAGLTCGAEIQVDSDGPMDIVLDGC